MAAQGKTKPEKLRNDVIDVNFAAFATYFDGLITSDKRAREIYAEAEFLLEKPPLFFVYLIVATAAYLVLVEITKGFFCRFTAER
jgi:hypothetical protein